MIKLDNYSASNIKNDVLSGLVVAVALVPEAIAFSFIAGVSPIVGLYTAFILGLITAIIGGKPGMISGATGAVAVVLVGLSIEVTNMYSAQGLGGEELAYTVLQYITLTAVVAGMLQIGAGVAKMGKFIRLVPQPAMYGFVNGLAIVIAMSQFKFFENQGAMMYILVFATMLIMHFLPRFSKAVPAGLVAIIGITIIVYVLNIDTIKVGDLTDLSAFAYQLPSFHIPDTIFTLDALMMVLPYAVIVALVGLIESLLTLSVLDEMSETRGSGNKECIAQGTGNVTCGVFGGMPGCAMIGQSIINYTSGGLGRLSGITAAIGLIALVATMTELLNIIPVAVLVGIMFMVSIGTFEWASYNKMKKMPKADAFVLVSVTVITIFADLAIAVITGVIISALVFAWKHARVMTKESIQEDGSKLYELSGPLFFASATSFYELFDIKNDPSKVVIDFKNTRVMDSSGVEAIDKLVTRYHEASIEINLQHLSPDCRNFLKDSSITCTELSDDPTYKVAVNY